MPTPGMVARWMGIYETPLWAAMTEEIGPCLGDIAMGGHQSHNAQENTHRCGQEFWCLTCARKIACMGDGWHVHAIAEVYVCMMIPAILAWVQAPNIPPRLQTRWWPWPCPDHHCQPDCPGLAAILNAEAIHRDLKNRGYF